MMVTLPPGIKLVDGSIYHLNTIRGKSKKMSKSQRIDQLEKRFGELYHDWYMTKLKVSDLQEKMQSIEHRITNNYKALDERVSNLASRVCNTESEVIKDIEKVKSAINENISMVRKALNCPDMYEITNGYYEGYEGEKEFTNTSESEKEDIRRDIKKKGFRYLATRVNGNEVWVKDGSGKGR